MNDKELEKKAKRFDCRLEELREEERVGWTPEYLLQHWAKEERILKVIEKWKNNNN